MLRPVLRATAFGVGAIIFGYGCRTAVYIAFGRFQIQPIYPVEWFIYVLAVVAIFVCVHRQPWIGQLDQRRHLLGAFFFMMVAGQVLSLSIQMFPLTAWGMYTSPNPDPYYEVYFVRTQSGRESHFPFAELVPTTSPRSLRTMLRKVLDTEGAEALQRKIEELVTVYNEQYPDDPVQEVWIVRRTIESRRFVDEELVRFQIGAS